MKPLWKYAALIGMAAALISCVADTLLLYNPAGGFLDAVPHYYETIPTGRFIWGHYLGIFFIPLELAGFLLVYKGLKPAGNVKAKAIYVLAMYATFPGVAYHATCAFMGHIMQGGGEAQYHDAFRALSDPLAVFFILGFLVLSVVFAVIVGRGKSLFPRWVAFCNPVSVYLVCLGLWFAVPVVGRLLLPAGFNLGIFVFLGVCLLTFKMKEGVEV